MTKRLSPLCTLQSLSASTGAGVILISSFPFPKNCLDFPEILCIKELCLCQATKYLESHDRASRADKAVHVAEEALGDERQATSLLWASFLQSTRLTQGTMLAA